MRKHKFPVLACIPVAAQFMENNLIALFSFEHSDKDISILCEKHYRLVEAHELSDEEIFCCGKRTKEVGNRRMPTDRNKHHPLFLHFRNSENHRF